MPYYDGNVPASHVGRTFVWSAVAEMERERLTRSQMAEVLREVADDLDP